MPTPRRIVTHLTLTVLLGCSAASAFEFAPRTLLHGQRPDTVDASPAIATDRQGRWVALWASRDELGGTGYDSDILAAHSDDAGATWSAPAPVNADATTDHLDYAQDISPMLLHVAGRWRAFWWKHYGTLRLFGAHSTDGVVWTQDLALPFEGSDLPHVATDGHGTWLIVWKAFDGRVAMLRSTDDGATWLPRVDLAVYPFGMNLNYEPRAMSDGAGAWLVAWYGGNALGSALGTDYDILAVRSADGGATWDAPAPIEPDAASDTQADGGVSPLYLPDGSWLLAWYDGTATGQINVAATRSVDGGRTWSPKVIVGPSGVLGARQYEIAAAQDGAGEVVLFWAANPNAPSPNMVAARSGDGGRTWTAPLAVGPANYGPSPALATDRAGTWLAAWETTRRPDGQFAQYHDIVVARGALCGDGRVAQPETCEPAAGDACCSAACRETAAGTPCAGDACHPDATCAAGRCDPGPARTCATCTTCDPSAGCVARPRDGCHRAITTRGGSLRIERARPQLRWQWQRGAATTLAELGDPTTERDGFALCLYETSPGAPALLSRAIVPGGGLCRGRPCWKPSRSGFTYRDRDAAAGGTTALLLRSGRDGLASIQLDASGPGLDVPPAPTPLPLTLQLHAASGACWEASFSASGVVRNDAASLRARPD